ncbi:hypothetical protein CDAR_260311 [Caerostris darwini]|uniref:Uncharacterized protein n=1 Tax=Caerostris darwini TaxID=1538125 RepID=A0AAV4P936_9ARAC|nr:hypothetical protein CDAR_260311 [Caerostris darwini]
MTKRFKLPFTKMSHLQGTISTAIKDQDKAELIAQNLENQFTLNDISDPMQDMMEMESHSGLMDPADDKPKLIQEMDDFKNKFSPIPDARLSTGNGPHQTICKNP